MARFNDPLANIRVAAPCSADWDGMVGSERVRFCGQCSRNVFNLSSMSKREAENLIEHTEGRLCIRFYRRADGTVLTDNCPVGLRALRRRVRRVTSAFVSAIFSFLAGIGIYAGVAEINRATSTSVGATTMGAIVAKPPSPHPVVVIPTGSAEQGGMEVMGRIAPLPTKTTRQPQTRLPR